MKLKTKKKGFTLVELLIVMTIIAMLSLLAINGYMEYRKSTLLDFAADSIVAQINEMRSRAIHGDSGSARADVIKEELDSLDSAEAASGSDSGNPSDNAISPSGTALCYGIYFGNDAIKTFSSGFIGKKRFIAGQWQYLGCEEFEIDPNDAEIIIDEQVKILNISDVNDVQFSNGFLRFVPPDGQLEISYDGLDLQDPALLSKLKIEIQYGLTDSSKYRRLIEYDLNNFTADVEELS